MNLQLVWTRSANAALKITDWKFVGKICSIITFQKNNELIPNPFLLFPQSLLEAGRAGGAGRRQRRAAPQLFGAGGPCTSARTGRPEGSLCLRSVHHRSPHRLLRGQNSHVPRHLKPSLPGFPECTVISASAGRFQLPNSTIWVFVHERYSGGINSLVVMHRYERPWTGPPLRGNSPAPPPPAGLAWC